MVNISLSAITNLSVVQEGVDLPELDDHQEEVKELAEDEIAKVPVVVVKDGLGHEALRVPLLHGLNHHTVVILLFFCNHHRCLSIRSKASDASVLQDAPHVVGGIEDVSMDGHDEGDPLVLGGVRGIVNALQLHDAHNLGLVLQGM